jgi:hypothetical protein
MSHAEKPGSAQPISWRALRRRSDVISADGARVGVVEGVLADRPSDHFQGIVVKTGHGPGSLRFVDATQLAGIFDDQVLLTVTQALIDELPAPRPGWRE